MKILMVLEGVFPPDVRVENEAVSLIRNGHEVGLISFGAHGNGGIVDYKGIKLYKVAISSLYRNKMHGLAAMIPWIDRFVAKQVLRVLKEEEYDVVHLHDLYLFGAARIIRNKASVKIVGDLHENYVDVLKDYRWSNTFPNNLLISYKKWTRKEKEWLQDIDKIVVVNEGMKQKNIGKGVPEENITIVENTLNTELFDHFEIDPSIIKKFEKYFVLVYVGGFVQNRGLEHVIKGMSKLKEYNSKIRLLLVGDGEMMDKLKALVEEFDLSECVIFEGFQSQEKIKSYLKVSNIGLVPFKRTPQTDNSSSNKLFQYMYYQLPVLGTDCTSVKKLVEGEKCGVIYESENEDQFVEKVKELFEDRVHCKIYGENGRRAVLDKYNWEVEAEKLKNLYNDL